MTTEKRSAKIVTPDGNEITIYAKGSRIARAVDELAEDMTLYEGVRYAQIMEAVYEQGIRDGRRQVVEGIQELTESKSLAYRNPGRPRNPRKKS